MHGSNIGLEMRGEALESARRISVHYILISLHATTGNGLGAV